MAKNKINREFPLEKQVGSKPKLLDQVRAYMRVKHYSPKTEEAYINWIYNFIMYNGKTHPELLTKTHIEKYLTYLAVNRNVLSPAREI